ncbi:MAG: hypothetical protein ABIX12_08940, partial [Rubrivivax sp.]
AKRLQRGAGRPACGRAAMRKSRLPDASERPFPMDIELINLIGTRLADLSARTDALRGYL